MVPVLSLVIRLNIKDVLDIWGMFFLDNFGNQVELLEQAEWSFPNWVPFMAKFNTDLHFFAGATV